MPTRRPLRLAWLSPLPPRHTGIADYSLALLRELTQRDGLAIELWHDPPGLAPEVEALGLEGAPLSELPTTPRDPELRIYHVGNHLDHHRAIYEAALRTPGLVVLHDYVLHHMLASLFVNEQGDPAAYVREMAYAHGPAGAAAAEAALARAPHRPWEAVSLPDYPLNTRVVRSARALLVHSRHAAEGLRSMHPGIAVHEAPMPAPAETLPSREHARAELGLPSDAFVVGSFGHVAYTKRIPSLLRAVAAVIGDVPLHCVVVGELHGPEVPDLVAELGLGERVRLTGYVPRESLRSYLAACDACVNLRHPTTGEASASVTQILAAAKPCAVSDDAWFADLPDDVVCKIPVDGDEIPALAACLRRWSADPALRARPGEAAARHARAHHDVAAAADAYVALARELAGAD